MPNVYLTGMMGSGKSVTGKKLAAALGYAFIDLDEWIQERTHKTIVEIFASEGEGYFRDQESKALEEVCASGPRVVATGGGTILKTANIEKMRRSGKIVFLETSLNVLWDRVKEKKDRPLLRGGKPQEKLAQILAARQSLYESHCDFKVLTDGKTAETVAAEIEKKLKT